MKVSCLQENLARGLSIVARAVAARSTLPVLANVLLATDNGRLRLTATNLEMGISCWIGAKIEDEGATTAPARTLVDLVNTLPNDRVDMDLVVRTQTLNVRCGSFNNDLKCIDAQEFPPLPQASEDEGLTLNVDDLKEMIAQVAFAASTDDARPVLTGVLLDVEDGRMTLAAADGFRLSVRTAHLSTPGVRLRAIVPARALAELARILGDGDETVSMVMPANRGQVVFRSKNVELVSQLIEGNFPDYQGIIPTTRATRTVLPTASFLKACKAADIFAREAAHSARLRITPGSELEPGRMTVSATSAETGSNETEVDATVEGGPIEIAFNVRFLVDVLGIVDTPNVALETNTAASPGVLRPVGRDDFLHVVMPMHLGR
ncbi:MAG TPA: DNA polymerase III subunit beta [Anaerolineales bacterium]|nr:DNA polymerase III subunit beta [Anaerolineales bacterium]